MRRIYTIRLRGMNARKAIHDLRAMPGAVPAELSEPVVARVKELYFGPEGLPRRDVEELSSVEPFIAPGKEEC